MSHNWSFVALSLFLLGCQAVATTPRTSSAGRGVDAAVTRVDIAAALLSGDEAVGRRVTNDVLEGRSVLLKSALTDERPISPNVVLRATAGNHDYQFGVTTVAEYALCLLQLRHETSSEAVLRTVDPTVAERCSATRACEVCNAQAFSVSADVKARLAEYWSPTLE
jgi:hypothetical protein